MKQRDHSVVEQAFDVIDGMAYDDHLRFHSRVRFEKET